MSIDRKGFDGKEWDVHKFGGTSVASSKCFMECTRILEKHLGYIDNNTSCISENENEREVDRNYRDKAKRLAVVVSAMGGKPKVTDLLISTVKAAACREDDTVETVLHTVLKKHFACINELPMEQHKIWNSNKKCWENARSVLKARFKLDLSDLRELLKIASLMKWGMKRIMELVAGYGELWSAQILATLLNSRHQHEGKTAAVENGRVIQHYFAYLDARRVICIDEETVQDGTVCWDISQQKFQEAYMEEMQNLEQMIASSNPNITQSSLPSLHFVVTGYVASNTDGVPTTLHRNGSDYSAAIMGKLLQSNSITIWTDVDGIFSADPHRVPEALVLPEVSFNEAMELAYFGAKVIHPKTMLPAISSDPPIPIYIRNTFSSSFKGTRIFNSSTTPSCDKRICGFTSIDEMALVNVEYGGLVSVPIIAKRLFGALEVAGINVVLISMANSKYTISFAISALQAPIAKEAIQEEFNKGSWNDHITVIDVIAPCSVIVAVGGGIHATTSATRIFFSALENSKINVLAISQGSSKRNILAAVAMEEATHALRAVHNAFLLSHTDDVCL